MVMMMVMVMRSVIIKKFCEDFVDTMDAIFSETDWVRNDKWTVLMEAASFGQAEVAIIIVFDIMMIRYISSMDHQVVSVLLERPGLELEAVNVRGQTAAEVAMARGHHQVGGDKWWGYVLCSM